MVRKESKEMKTPKARKVGGNRKKEVEEGKKRHELIRKEKSKTSI